jgi:UDP-3-O-[3-hydroxymyristoyl] glucosamine N-acyltransferase
MTDVFDRQIVSAVLPGDDAQEMPGVDILRVGMEDLEVQFFRLPKLAGLVVPNGAIEQFHRVIVPRRAVLRKEPGYESHAGCNPPPYGGRLAKKSRLLVYFIPAIIPSRAIYSPTWKRRMLSVMVTVKQLAALVKGQVQGDGDLEIAAARPLQDAGASDITYIDGDKHLTQLHASAAAAAVAPPTIPLNGKTLIQVSDPMAAFIAIVKHLHGRPELPVTGIDARAYVHPSVKYGSGLSVHPYACIEAGTVLGERCRIHSGVVIGRDCKIGNDVVIYPNAVLYDGTCLADRVIVHANAVLGADGFGYRFQDGKHVKVPQQGYVQIEADVEIGACTTIDRGTFGATTIGLGTKIDNLVQIGHNCRIGKHNIFVSQLGMAGSCSTGNYVVIAGQVGVADHVHIGDGAIIGAKAGVVKDIPAGQKSLGAPATPEREQKRILMTLEHLPDMRKDLRKIKQQLGIADES